MPPDSQMGNRDCTMNKTHSKVRVKGPERNPLQAGKEKMDKDKRNKASAKPSYQFLAITCCQWSKNLGTNFQLQSLGRRLMGHLGKHPRAQSQLKGMDSNTWPTHNEVLVHGAVATEVNGY
ncbi:PR domain zinc finger protein 15 [Platysternon megacephalum]|uniref:PR domain zinc finger protein 15 n=1 Tax=Platysternon megacephalum TaxID=55544 RepID=A0A4D9E5R0_9SAUR|nr:PR domain zinc finger protein 15 [Platysternon megacephalum]